MPTTVITGTITDSAGVAVSGVTVVCTLKPYGYRITEGTAISARQSTTTNGSGVYTFTLEETSNITPQGSYYELEERIPIASGGRRVWVITVGADNATVAASLLASAPDQGVPDYLTQDQGDSRYLTSVAAAAGYQPLDSDLTAIAALTTTSYGRAVLALANEAALAALLVNSFQPLDGDLTSIAALTTTSYGRALLTLANAAAADWVTKATGTAKGSLIGFSASSTPSELTVGSNGKMLIADSAQTPGLKWISYPDYIDFALSDETTAITTGTAKLTWRAPYAMTITGVRASLTTSSSSGIPTVDINDSGTTILSTKLTIDANELTSTTAATAAVISDSAIADDAEVTFDIDVAGTGAKGLKVRIYFTRVLS